SGAADPRHSASPARCSRPRGGCRPRSVNVLAIDQGTSATKALVVGPQGGVLGAAEGAVHPTVLDDGGGEQDPEELWTSVLDAGGRASAQVRDPIGAIALANQGETVLAWDRATGNPLSRAIIWQDRRSGAICDRLSSRGWRERLHALTGLRLDP